MNDILLIAADDEERRLLFAELREAGYAVLPVPGLGYAMRMLSLRAVAPPLVLLDAHDDAFAKPVHVERLTALAGGAPVILIVGAMGMAWWEPLRPKVAALLCRPISIGEIVDVVRRILPADQPKVAGRDAT
jgi:DNA-binding NtrC family response regulator